ncbi:MAG: flagellar basal body P-ring protein FlgI [Acidobacteriota bacterium]|nr:flagellar basal body P-ring protein FlgI [Acidobacteriota bacterium]
MKDLATFEGMRDNQLVGYGLVVGLAGTGDRRQAVFSTQSLTNLLQRMGVSVDPNALTVKNTAAVMVTATLPAFAQPGSHIDVTAAAVGDAPNLQGGILVLTSLRGPNGQVYAVAQGAVVTGGFSAGKAGNTQSVNHPTVGRVPNGAIVERAAPSIPPGDHLKLQIKEADFTTAARVSAAVNLHFKASVAKPENSALVSIAVPEEFRGRPIEFMAELEILTVEVDRTSRVIVNERTGTIVMGKDVRISPVAILQGNLTVEIKTTFDVAQPAPLSTGTTAVTPEVTVGAKEEKTRNIVLKQGATVEELVRALAAIGSTSRDVIAILQSLRAAGALEADLEVI